MFLNTSKKLGLNAQTLGTAISRGAQADKRGATLVLDRGGKAVASVSCLPKVLDRDAEAVVRGAVFRASQVLGRGVEAAAQGAARYASLVLDHGAQAGAQNVACGNAALSQQEKNTRQMSRRK